ncbi:MAG: hypothetical protein U1D41_17800 [Nitrosomonas sp.]|uniref:hypothetical protein n=1 Tax=Nitrosomonas sp. TaxID=42353 RepID=UPI0027354C45|nr:hypothetical protein [Nitrosomonas sp.]MBK6958232.1 hypothetical protein [Nitrosomonas sp.]MDP1934613.1 hypothetical protein [Nitrosomonas sp.]MDP3282764.1 hypothetical protein [Nitrosomonas sp.]MDP3662097.1 hypothetical protein [Nitrosomonas sp.]MDZ4107966.1 hypothetical protein [Nitrosomonas sp.]
MTRQITQAGIAVFILVMALYTSTASAHGKVAMEDDSCMRRIGENMIHLSTYQPQVNESGHYCTDIPKAGSTVLVIDLVDPALRDMPIGVKVIKGSNASEGETITNTRPALYQDGVISMSSALDQGKYLVQVTAEGVPPLHYEYHMRVEMINYADVFRASIGPVVGLLLTTILGYKLIRSRRFRDWLASRRAQKD